MLVSLTSGIVSRKRPEFVALRLRALVASLMVCLIVGLVAGDVAAESAKTMLARGNRLFAAGDYRAAYLVYETAQKSTPRPVFLRSMAFCKLKMYQHEAAQKLLRQYLAEYPQAKDGTSVAKTISALETVVHTKIAIASAPPGAHLYIDVEAAGQIGTTPYTGTIEPGTHTVILRAPGYATTTHTFRIEPGKRIDLAIPLHVAMTIISHPEGASVHVDHADANSLGKTPLNATIRPGKHSVFLKRAGYHLFSSNVVAQPGKPVEMNVSLMVGLRVASVPAGAAVTFDRKSQPGVTPLSLEAVPGTHRININRNGFKPYVKDITLAPGQNSTLNVRLTGGLLSMRTNVTGAALVVGGLHVGTTPIERVAVPLGKQTVQLIHPERRSWQRAIEFTDGELVSARVAMGHRTWPLWTLVAVSGAALISGAIIGGLAIANRNDINNSPVYYRDKNDVIQDTGLVGYCTNDGGYPQFNGLPADELLGGDNKSTPITQLTSCSYGLHHTATALLAAGTAGAIGAAIYYWFFARPEATLARQPRGAAVRAVDAARPSRQLN